MHTERPKSGASRSECVHNRPGRPLTEVAKIDDFGSMLCQHMPPSCFKALRLSSGHVTCDTARHSQIRSSEPCSLFLSSIDCRTIRATKDECSLVAGSRILKNSRLVEAFVVCLAYSTMQVSHLSNPNASTVAHSRNHVLGIRLAQIHFLSTTTPCPTPSGTSNDVQSWLA